MNSIDIRSECCENAIEDRYNQEYDKHGRLKACNETRISLWSRDLVVSGRELGSPEAGPQKKTCIACQDCIDYYRQFNDDYQEIADPKIIKTAHQVLSDRKNSREGKPREYRRSPDPEHLTSTLPF